MAAASSSSKRAVDGDEGLEYAMENMHLQEGELDDVVVGVEEVEELEKAARWLAVARVNTSKTFSSAALKETLKFIWNLAHPAEIREADDNLFVIQMFCLGDWKRVMYQGPWIFRGLMVLIEEYDGQKPPDSVKLDRVLVWAQIHKLPDLYRNEAIVDQLARRIGIVRSVEMNPNRFFEGNYVRVRASIETSKPLIRWTPLNIAGKERLMLDVKYEKIGF